MTIYGKIKQNKIAVKLGFDTVYVGGDNREAKRLLYNWMLAHGYAVTSDMTILQMVRILTGTAAVRFSVLLGVLRVEDASGASVSGSVVSLTNGASFIGNNTLKLEDV